MKILLLQLKRIGDLILTLPAIEALREKFPDAEITLVVAKECAELLPAMSTVDHAHVARRNLRDISLFFTIARQKFDCCIDFTQNDRSALLTFLSGAPKRIGASRVQLQSGRRARVYNEFAHLRLKEMHTIDYNLSLLEPLGIRNARPDLRLQLPESARTKARELLRAAKIDNHFVVLHPGSARVEKFWEAERWAAVITHAQTQLQTAVVITGGTWRFEQEHIQQIKERAGNAIVDLSGKTDLLTLAAVINEARLLVTVDSAAMHLAATQRTPQVILFGPTNPFHWRPRETAALILQGESGAPVTTFVPKQPRASMRQISTEAVINGMDALLSPAAARTS
ncbi:MAG TPA: putative lipopolysaccharide heptosyltransferase III [Chthoniobacterales bacterium]|nr:putative lipopolysaccharide heptosyltransferase III [Chthoniobacterales bacterium]